MEKLYEIVRIKQVINEVENEYGRIGSPDDASEIVYDFIGEDDREVFLVICLNTKNKVIAVHRAHVGSINSSIVHPREVFKSAFLNNSASLIVAHNHPSGDPSPSQEDIHVTKRLCEAGKILGIEILDHIVVGEKRNGRINFVSLKEKGYL